MRFQDEFQQMKTRIVELGEESRQTRAELALFKTNREADSQETTGTITGRSTLSQHMRKRLGVYSKSEVEDVIHDGKIDTIAREELCNQGDLNVQFEEF